MFWQDVRHGLRQLRRSPGFAAVAIATLAIGIGATTAIFSFVNTILLRPLPYPDADRLAIVWSGLGYSNRAPASAFELFQLRLRTKEFDRVEGIWVTNGALPGEGEAEQVKIGVVTANFLSLLCSTPAVGRFLDSNDAQPNAQQKLVISHGVWVRRFGADPAIIGRSVRFGSAAAIVVGVLPDNFRIMFPGDASVPSNVDVFYTIPIGPSDPNGPAFLHVIGRLQIGSNLARAQAEADAIAAQVNALGGRSVSKLRLYVFSLHADDVRDVRSTLLLLFGGVGLVLLIGCANVANLLLARAKQRLRETTIRAALGASRGRLVRQSLTESLLLGCAGGLASLAVGSAVIRAVLAARPPSLATFDGTSLDVRAFVFAFGIAAFTALIVGLAPVIVVYHLDVTRSLKEANRPPRWRTRYGSSLLVSAEVALAFVLLLATGLLTRTFVNILRVNPGFRPENVLSFRISGVSTQSLRQLQERLTVLHGVQSVAAVSHLPLGETGNWYDYYWSEHASPDVQNTVMADHRSILPGYFSTIGAQLLSGRDFADYDDARHQHVAIVDDLLARQLWPDSEAVGRKLNVSDSPEGFYQFQRDWVVVIGVVKHIHDHSLTAIMRPQVYLPFPIAPRPTMSMVVRTSGVVPNLAKMARKEVDLVNREIPVSQAAPLDDIVALAHSSSRFASLLATLLAATALLLACVGVYGVLSYSVVQRTSEIGIRMALGARPIQVMRMVLTDGLVSVLRGLATGFVLSLMVMPLLGRLLFGVTPRDTTNYAVIVALVLFAGALAALPPALRAVRVDPLRAVKYE